MNPEIFLDWLTSVDHFFPWHQQTEGKYSLLLLAQMLWARIQEANKRSARGEVATWDEMKTFLKGSFLPMDYQQNLFFQFHRLQQGDGSVDEYTEISFELSMRPRVYQTE